MRATSKGWRGSLCLILSVALACPLAPAAALAAEMGISTSQEFGAVGMGSEYVSGNFPGAVLMPINLWGSIAKPGIHHVPMRTDLVTLMSLAGGPGADAELSKVTIKRRSKGEETVIKVDAEDLLTKAGVHSPVLEANDIIIVPRDKPTINPNTVATISFVGTIISLVLAGLVLNNTLKK